MFTGAFGLTLCDASISAIDWYRRVVSPHKGFSCAYRVRNGGESCSQFARRAFEAGRWWPGVQAVIVRFRLCGEAARVLRRERVCARFDRARDEYFDYEPGEPKSADPGDSLDQTCACVMRECGAGCLRSCLPELISTLICGP